MLEKDEKILENIKKIATKFKIKYPPPTKKNLKKKKKNEVKYMAWQRNDRQYSHKSLFLTAHAHCRTKSRRKSVTDARCPLHEISIVTMGSPLVRVLN